MTERRMKKVLREMGKQKMKRRRGWAMRSPGSGA